MIYSVPRLWNAMRALEVLNGNSGWNEGAEGLFTPEAVVALLLDAPSRRIVMSTIQSGKMVEEIRAETGIPLSTCYRKVAELVKENVLVAERMVMTTAGKKYAIYRSAIAGVRIDVRKGAMDVSVLPNPEVAGRLQMAMLAKQFEH